MKKIFILLLVLSIAGCEKADSPALNEVFIQNKSFSPQQITIKQGTTITWTNKEALQHAVTSNSKLFDSGLMKINQTFKYTFTTPGVYDYYCKVYSSTGTVIVN